VLSIASVARSFNILRSIWFSFYFDCLLISINVCGFPPHVELEGLSNYLANIPVDEYGPPINVPDSQKEELMRATDDYCLGSLKVAVVPV
jgi:hypothetical protein